MAPVIGNGMQKKVVLGGIALLVILNFLGFMAFYSRFSTSSRSVAAIVDASSTSHEAEQEQLAKLLQWCHGGTNWTITRGNAPLKQNIQEDYLNTCYPIELSSSQGGRSMGHCSDFVLYVFYAGARLTREFPVEVYKRKAQNCPRTTFLHGEYPIPTLFDLPVRNVWMPNAEQISKGQAHFFWKSDLILAKTMQSYFVLRKYVMENNIPVHVKYAPHSSPDPLYQVKNIGNSKDFNSFYHAKGHSGLKGTPQLLECWSMHPEWPVLHFVAQESRKDYQSIFRGPAENIKFYEKFLPMQELRQLQFTSGVHLCPSIREGFGHYINEARALGAIVITNDFGPMNEFVSENSGFLAAPRSLYKEDYQLLEPVQITLSPENICEAIENLMKKSIAEREEMSREARRLYLEDYLKMKISMGAIKRDALKHLHE
jgi:glycosyltransferase involved in cell wall biosynthesis